MIKKMIRKISHAKTFVVLLAGLDTGFSVINGLLTHKSIIRKKTVLAGAKPDREVVTVPIQPLLVQTLRATDSNGCAARSRAAVKKALRLRRRQVSASA